MPTPLTFNWSAQSGNISGGFTQDTGGINVGISYFNNGAGNNFSSVTTAQYVDTAAGETFATNSAAQLGGSGGDGDTSITTVDFSSVAGSGFSETVENVSFRINDFDTGSWIDEITVRAYDANGNQIEVSLTFLGTTTTGTPASLVSSSANGSAATQTGSILVNIAGPVSYIEIDYDNGSTGGQALWLTDIHFDAIELDGTVEGTAGDDVIDGTYILDPDGDRVDGGDEILPGYGADGDLIEAYGGDDIIRAGAGDDSVFGGTGSDRIEIVDVDGTDYFEGGEDGDGTDVDVVAFSSSSTTQGVNVTATADEAGTYNYDGTTASGTYSEIEEIVLTDFDDTFDGVLATGGNTVDGGAGDDVLTGSSGVDSFVGGVGNDTLNANQGDDILDGGAGNDTVFGDEGADSIQGGTGDDQLFGGQDNDTIDGGGDNDFIEGGSGNDDLSGGDGDDTLFGGNGDDTLFGGDGSDTLTGGADQDVIYGGAGDVVDGSEDGTDNDTLFVSGVDYIDYDDLNPENGVVFFEGGGSLTFSNIENVIVTDRDGTVSGTAGDDLINTTYVDPNDGDQVDDTDAIIPGHGINDDLIEAGAGNDEIDAGTGADTIYAGTGNDLIFAGADGSADTVFGEAGDDTMFGFDGDDELYGGADNDTVDGDGGDDSLYGGAGDDQLIGDAGDDIMVGGSGNDTFFAGADDDTIFGGEGDDLAYGGTGNDTFEMFLGNDTVFAGDGDDTIDGAQGADELYGGDGNDIVLAGSDDADDTLFGGAGNDSLSAGEGEDTLFGGTGDDTQFGAGGDDVFVLEENFGNDTITGGETDETVGDTLDASQVETDLTVDLSTLQPGNPEMGTISDGTDSTFFQEIENIILGTGDDSVSGSSGDENIDLGSGADTFDGGAGDDTVDLGSNVSGNPDGDADVIILQDGFGNDTVANFDAPTPNGDGTFTGIDTLEVSNLLDAGGIPVNTNDVVVTDDGAGNALLTFPNGETLVLEGLDPADVDNPFYLNAIGIPLPDGTVSGTAGNDLIDTGYIGDPDGDLVDNDDAILPGDSGDDDLIEAGAGNDTILAGDGNDEIYAGTGDDTITGGAGDDTQFGESGDDTFVLENAFGDDAITGGETGETVGDTLDASGVTTNLTVDLETQQPGNPEAGTLADGTSTATFEEIENIILGSGDDSVTGSGGNDNVDLGSGADTFDGGAGDDTVDLGTTGAGSPDGDPDVIILQDGFGNDTVTNFDAPTDNGDGTFTGIDTLDVTNLTDGTDPVNVNDVTVTDDGAGNALLTFPNGETIILDGIDPVDADDPFYLNAIGIPLSDGTVSGTAGNDIINGSYTGDPDGDMIDADDAILAGDTGNDDLIEAGAGNDTVIAGDGDDEAYGDTGNDSIEGGLGDDTIFGGGGQDTLIGGTGTDTLYGGTGDDTVTFAEGDTAIGGTGDDLFVLEDLGEPTNGTITVDGGSGDETGGDTLQLGDLAVLTDAVRDTFVDDGTGSFSGSITLDDGTILNFSEIENIICFTPETRIATPKGLVAIEDLSVGDLVVTRDHGLQPIRWIESRTVPAIDRFAPVRIGKNVLAGQERDLIVSPQHRVLFHGYRAELLFGESEVLVSARHLVDGLDVTQDEGAMVTYVHFLFDQHEIVYAEGAATESFHPGDIGFSAVGEGAREELFAIFPELRGDPREYGNTARRCLKSHEAQLLRR